MLWVSGGGAPGPVCRGGACALVSGGGARGVSSGRGGACAVMWKQQQHQHQLELSSILDGIYGSGLAVAEKRRIASRVSATHAKLCEATPASGSSGWRTLEDCELALDAEGRRGPFSSKPTITDAKRWLRSQGPVGVSLATRLGKLSKCRNMLAHPDPV